MVQARMHVPLLATVVLALDDEGEEVGRQLLQLSQTLDPLARARLRLLRLRGHTGAIFAAPLTESDAVGSGLPQPLAVKESATLGAYGYPNVPFQVAPEQLVGEGQAATIVARGSRPVAPQGEPLEAALRVTLQEAARTGGAEPLAQHGFRLVPNEVAVYLVGRADAEILAETATKTHAVTHSLGAQTDARRFALLMVAPPTDEPRPTAPPPTLPPQLPQTVIAGSRPPREPAPPGNATPEWRLRTMAQPWQRLLSWEQGEPPLLYAFLCEPWDEAGRYLKRPELRFAMAEVLFSLFATGVLEHPDFREALDLSTAAIDVNQGLERFGSIGTARVTAPTAAMTDYLAHCLAADVLLRRGLLGEAGGVALPETRASIPDEARRDAERWVREGLRAKIAGAHYALPPKLPPRILDNGERGDWSLLALSSASPDPTGLLWRWGPRQWRRFPLDSEAFWNLSVQNEYETSGESVLWTKNLAETIPALEVELRRNLDDEVRLRTLGAEGVDRAQAFADAVSTALLAEQRRVQDEQKLQEHQLALHHRHLEDELRRAHPRQGIPTFPNPPYSDRTPLLPRNMEALAHEVIDAAFARVPLPLTVVLAAAVVALFGAEIIPAFALVPGVEQLPSGIYQALTGNANHWYGALTMLAIFALALIVPLVRGFQLRGWQRRYAEERDLLWLARARERERYAHLTLIADIVQQVERERSHILGWAREIEQAAAELQRQAEDLAAQTLAGPALTRDLYVAKGVVWEGIDPNDLYLRVRERQDEPAIVRRFLSYVQAHMGDVVQALKEGTIDGLALEFMRTVLRDEVADEPFGEWTPEQAREALDRARQSARVLMQPQVAGRPLAKFAAIAVDPSIAWIDRLAAERHMVTVPLATTRWAVVVRCITRTRLGL